MGAAGKEKTFEDSIVENPISSYIDFHSRLLKDGINAPFPEFKPVVDFLLKELETEEFKEIVSSHSTLDYEYKEVKTMLAHVNMVFTFDDKENYPYPQPFIAPFPYRPTLDAIEAAIRFFDKLNRLQPDNKAVPLYHFDRYAYHRHSLVADPDVVLYPTIRNLTFYDLIRTRCVPIGFIGVFSKTVRVDRHQQSPLDFWYHDLNHIRRMLGYVKLSQKQKNISSEMQKLGHYQDMDKFIVEKILPAIAKLPKGSPPEEVAIRRMVRIIVFEILHESALTSEPDAIIEDLLRPAGHQPFEHMVVDEDENIKDDIEKLRTPTGNIKSGVSVVKSGPDSDENQPIKIRYFHDRALALLANVYNKLNFGFYDDPENPSDFVVPIDYRKPEHVVDGAKRLLEILEVKEMPSDETLMNLVVSREGSSEKFIYKGVHAKDDMGVSQSATEPISANEIISQVKSLKKTIYTLFGYSLLEYEDKEKVMAEIKEELSKLDPKTTVICAGATMEGIGAAYKIAKDLGFFTIGVVSTQALFYSGKFSEYVDSIFIVNDPNWGGYIPGTDKLAETTRAFLEVSDVISAHGGGENTKVTLVEAKKRNMKVIYSPAEMNHEIADKQAKLKGEEGKVDYNGAASKVSI